MLMQNSSGKSDSKQASLTLAADSLSVAVCQLTSTDDVDKNVEQIIGLLQKLEQNPPNLVCFPENALFMRIEEGSKIPEVSLENKGIDRLSHWAATYGCTIHLGSVPTAGEGKLFNTSVLLTPSGQRVATYKKIHLFDVDVEGHQPVRESDVFAAGSEPSVFTVNGWNIGGSICYDLRFSELFLHYARLGVDAIVIPAAFLVPTGEAHWTALVRARAIECQAYVLAAAQGGTHQGLKGGKRNTYGNSMIVDPWGTVLAEVKNAPDILPENRILRAVLTKERLKQVRRQIPVAQHRRLSGGP